VRQLGNRRFGPPRQRLTTPLAEATTTAFKSDTAQSLGWGCVSYLVDARAVVASAQMHCAAMNLRPEDWYSVERVTGT